MHAGDSGEISLVLKSETFDGRGKAGEPTVVMINAASQLADEIERIANVSSLIGGDNAARVMRGPEIIDADGRSLSSTQNEEEDEIADMEPETVPRSRPSSRRASHEEAQHGQAQQGQAPQGLTQQVQGRAKDWLRRASKESRASRESRPSTESPGESFRKESTDQFPVLGAGEGLITASAITTALGDASGVDAVGAIVIETAGACWSMPEFQAKMLEGVEVRHSKASRAT